MPEVMQGEFAINGSNAELFTADNEKITEVQRLEGSIRINRRDIPRAGTRSIAFKAMTVTGEGSMTYVKVTSRWLREISELFRSETQIQRRYNFRYRLDDPEALGVEEVRLINVRFWEVPFGFNVNDIIEESIPFTFDRMEILQAIEGDPTISQFSTRYTPLD